MTALTLYAVQSAASADAAALRWRAITSARPCSSVARATSSVFCGTKWNAILRSSAIIVGEMQAWQPRNGLLPANQDRSRRALGEEVGRRGRNYFGRMTPQIVENLLWFYTDPGSSRSM